MSEKNQISSEQQQLLDAMTQARALDILQEKGWDYLISDGAAGLSVGQAWIAGLSAVPA